MAGSSSRSRALVAWFPDWPITAWERASGQRADHPVVVVANNQVVAGSAAAYSEGIRLGQRRREAQSRYHRLQVIPDDPGRDLREFTTVLRIIEELSPGVQLMEPGRCALRITGLAGYLGSETEAAETLLEAVVGAGITTGRIGIADDLYTAWLAARQADPVYVVAPGGSPKFLSGLPVSLLGDAELGALLPRLGIHTLGAFAELDLASVRARFGATGVRLQGLAAGRDRRVVIPRTPPQELDICQEFEPGLELADQVAFAIRGSADRFVAQLTSAGLVCTELLVEISAELGELSSRLWLHPGWFDAPAVVDRVRWQLQAAAGDELRSAVTAVQLIPVGVDQRSAHEPGLFGQGPDERVHHALSRVQAMLGHSEVVTARLCGGRWLTDRFQLVPWGDRPTVPPDSAAPWPGQLPPPLPATVFPEPVPLRLLDATQQSIGVDDRGRLSAAPEFLSLGSEMQKVIGWTGPWSIAERGWDPLRRRTGHRFQLVAADGAGWLVVLTGQSWWAEARYG